MGNCLSQYNRNKLDSKFGSNVSLDMAEIKAGFCNADPITTEGKRIQMAQMLLIPLIPIIILIVQTVLALVDSVNAQDAYGKVEDKLLQGHDLGQLIHGLQLERVESIKYVVQNQSDETPLFDAFNFTDSRLSTISKWVVSEESLNENDPIGLLSKKAFINMLDQHRKQVLTSSSVDDSVHLYTMINSKLLQTLLRSFKSSSLGSNWQKMLAYNFLLDATENHGIQMDIGWSYFDQGEINVDNFITFVKNSAVAKEHIRSSEKYSSKVASMMKVIAAEHRSLIISIDEMSVEIKSRQKIEPAEEKAGIWLASVNNYIELLLEIWNALEDDIFNDIEAGVKASKTSVAIAISLLVLVIIVAPVIFFLVYQMTSTIQNYAMGLSLKTKELRREKKRSDTLLYQMLPKPVALQLKMGKRVSADTYNHVTIFFSDLCGFTALSSRSSPMQVVEFLNKLYFFYDTTIEKFDVYKVETIGDAYMVASGVPQRNGPRHVGEISSLSLELVDGIRVFRIPHLPNESLRLRVGLHTGPVVAGVVGSKMPRYCLFGETVNIASKMESCGVPMKIQISCQCKEALDDLGGFTTERRGMVQIGATEDSAILTHYLTGRNAGHKSASITEKDTPILGALMKTYNG